MIRTRRRTGTAQGSRGRSPGAGPAAVAVIVLAAATVAACAGADPTATSAGVTPAARASATTPATPRPAPSLPVDPNDAWFVDGARGAVMAANEVVEDPDLFEVYFGAAEADVYDRHDVALVRTRSYYTGSHGGAAMKVVSARHPRAVIAALDRIDGGLGRPYARVPGAMVRRDVSSLEDDIAHKVNAYFYTVTFPLRRHVVIVEAYGISDPAGRRLAATYSREMYELLRARDA